MRMQKIDMNQIIFNEIPYCQSMKDSIQRIGLSFAIKVIKKESTYYCQDGHKRLSAIRDIVNENAGYESLLLVPIIILNDGSTRSNDCWKGRNSH